MSAQAPIQPQEAQSVSRPTRWPLIIMPTNRDENVNKDARLVNGYMEKELQGDIWLYKRPGLEQFSRPSGGNGLGQGAFNWLGDVYTIFNGTLYKNGTNVGTTINTTNGVYRFSSIMGAIPKLVFANGVRAYCYDDTNGLQDFTGGLPFTPPFYKGMAYLDEVLYLMSPFANLWGSPANDVTSPWAADNVIIPQIEPDKGVAVSKQLVYVVVFKTTSTEIFFDAANAEGSPLGRVSGAKLDYGCANQDSVRKLDGALFWLSTNESASVQVMKMENLKAEIVSTPAIERLLAEADFSEVYSWTLKWWGHRWYAIILVNNNLTLMFDMNTGLWSQWTDSNGNYLPIADSTYDTATARTLLQHTTNGRLYSMDGSAYTDDGAAITLDIYTPQYDAQTARDKTLRMMYFDCSQTDGSVLQVRRSDDDYRTWSDFRPVDCSLNKPRLGDEGVFKRRAYNFRHRTPTPYRIKAVDLQIDMGSL